MFPLNVIAAAEQVRISLTTQTIPSADVPPGPDRMVAGVRVGSDGNMYRVTGWNNGGENYGVINLPDDWNDLKKQIDKYEAMATGAGGDDWDLANALNTWINCSLQPQWGAQRGPAGSGTTTAIITVQIRQVSTGLVKASEVYTCVATEL